MALALAAAGRRSMVARCLVLPAVLLLASPRLAAGAANYSQADAINYLYLAISAYCGAPKFETAHLDSWSCGPSCKSAGDVTDVTTISDQDLGVFGFVGRYQGSCLVGFRGTFDAVGDLLDTDWSLEDYPGCSGCKVHKGLQTGYSAVKNSIVNALEQLQCSEIALAGHSLGASLAILATFDLGSSYKIKENYNFGAYRVGNAAFAAAYNAKHLSVTHRITHQKDPVPLFPLKVQGYQHVGGEVHYPGDVSQGYRLCQGNEDLTCLDQYCPPGSCGLIEFALFAAANVDSHLTYMEDVVSIKTDGASCSYLSTDRLAQQAALATAAYCPAGDVQAWSCGRPCEKVVGGVQEVQPLNLPVEVKLADQVTLLHGTITGFVGKWGSRCVLSLADPFGPDKGLDLLESMQDLVDLDLAEACPDCQVHSAVKQMYDVLASPLRAALGRIGCTSGAASPKDRRLVVTGHGFGAALGAVAAMALKRGDGYTDGTFGVEVSGHFGAPRVGDERWAKAYRRRLGSTLDRVTHRQDPFLQLPPSTKGYVHEVEEIFFDSVASGSPSSYVRCTDLEEDARCSMRHNGTLGPLSDHSKYMQPMLEFDMAASSCGHGSASAVVV